MNVVTDPSKAFPMSFAGLPVNITEAVFPNHLKVERSGIFCGRAAYAEMCACFRNSSGHNGVYDAFWESLRTGKSVEVKSQ